jgi:hypothetical protein
MKAIVESDGTKGVKLKSYCKKHTEKGDIDDDGKVEVKKETESQASRTQHEIEIATSIPEESKDNHENDFWKYIDINKVQQEIAKMSQNQPQIKNFNFIDFVLQYWKLKRTSNYGASLIKLTSSAQFEEQQQQQRTDILRLRVDLERIRNLSYMICRREKVKRNWLSAHQSSVEQALTHFTGINTNSETTSRSVQLSEESSKLVRDIVNSSVIYNYNETEDKTRINCILKTLKRLSKIEQIQKHKPNPYAKFYISHVKRKQENESLVSQTINGVSTMTNASNNSLNGALVKTKLEKPLNGLSSPTHQIKLNSLPVNGIYNKSESEKKSPLNYRQSPRSLLKPKTTSPTNVINCHKEEKCSTPVPVLTRSNLSGYKIPKKKQEQNSNISKFESEIDESIEKFRRRLEPELYTNIRSPNKNSQKISCNQTTQLYNSSADDFNYYNSHSQRGQYMTRGKNNRFFNRNNSQQSLLRNISTRAQHGIDEAALVASAANDIDMRRHHSSGFRPPLIH